jgi:hypothetical protein
MTDLFSFEWDTMFVFPSPLAKDIVYREYQRTQKEFDRRIVFVKDSRIMYYEDEDNYERAYSFYILSNDVYYGRGRSFNGEHKILSDTFYTPETAVFSVQWETRDIYYLTQVPDTMLYYFNSYDNAKRKKQIPRIYDRIKSSKTDSSSIIRMTDLFSFEWDTMFVFPSNSDYRPKYQVFQGMARRIVFVKGSEIMYCEDEIERACSFYIKSNDVFYERMRSFLDVRQSLSDIFYTPETAVFSVKLDESHDCYALTPISNAKKDDVQ